MLVSKYSTHETLKQKGAKDMLALPEIEKAIKEITESFEGSFSMKTPAGKYFYVSDYWLAALHLQRDAVIGKTDAEIFTGPQADAARETDLEAIETKHPIEYVKELVHNDITIRYIAIKWAFILPHGMPFCICTLADFVEHKGRVFAQKEKIDEYLHVMSLVGED
ncbi:MAG: hypothetical protein ACKVOR_08220 [Flavobacteriales bacterium]